MRIIGYVRVSKVGKRGKAGTAFHSPADQEAAIRGWAAVHHPGASVVIAPHELDASGAHATRPVWTGILDAACAGEYGLVVVAKFDRAARDVRHLLDVIDRLREAGVGFASVQEAVDTTTPVGRMLATVIGAMAEWERARKRDEMAATRADALAAGVWCGQAPLGYVRDARRHLVVDPPAADRVREAFHMRVTGSTWVTIARHVGLTMAGTRAVIANPLYKGTDHVERVVADDLWAAAQPAHRQGARVVTASTTGALRAIARCSGCGRAMCVHRGNYGCTNQLCSSRPSVSVAALDDHVRDAFADALGSATPLGEMMRERKEYGGAMAQVREQVAAAQADVDGWAARAARLRLDDEELAAGRAERRAMLAEAHAELDRLLSLGAEPPAAIAPGLTPEQADLAERRAEMAKVVAAVYVSKARRGGGTRWAPVAERVRIDWRGADAVVAQQPAA